PKNMTMSHPENKLNIRRARPQTLAGAVGGLMQLFGRRASDADLVARWDEIMGPDIAAMARPGVLRPILGGNGKMGDGLSEIT
ncbi:DUF721 domain-containing protein, partial [bacterium]|nr:DUF721 domain-containing protein [bacterium]